MAKLSKIDPSPFLPPPAYRLEVTDNELHFLKAALLLQTQRKNDLVPQELRDLVRAIDDMIYVDASSPARTWFVSRGGWS